ncbi:MAG: FdrA family protein [Motilibacteraceae bacterium]
MSAPVSTGQRVGTGHDHVEVRAGAYRDSVSLMQVSRAAQQVPGVSAASICMATPLNLDLIEGMGFPRPEAGPNDLVVALRAADEDSLAAALAAVEAALAQQRTTAGAAERPSTARSVRAAAARQDATLALVSVPGPYAFVEAMDALEAGLHVMVFSDNVPVEQEVRLKEEGARRGLLVMGPDCGTAVVGGVGLGFADVVRPGPVGIVAASGTGAQHLMALLDAAGVGVSHCLGVGGRDLSAAVGARSTRQALALLDADPATELVVLVSKPADPAVAASLESYAASLRTPVLLATLGRGRPDLTAVAGEVLRALGRAAGPWPEWGQARRSPRPAGSLRGLFCGGTLCDEAMVVASELLGPIRSNIPLDPAWALPPGLPSEQPSEGHWMVDFGDDALTAGRPHPMIDPSLRLACLADVLADPATGAVLLDVVLGHGAHPDPAAGLADVIDGSDVPVVVSLTGTAGDPQGLERQGGQLADAGAHVLLSNAAAARAAAGLVSGEKTGEQR